MKRKTVPPQSAADPSMLLRQAQAQLEQAEAFRQKRNLDRAESICTGLLKQHPKYFVALYTMGLVCADKNDYGRALIYLVRALIENPRSNLALHALTGVLTAIDGRGLASRILEIELGLSPND